MFGMGEAVVLGYDLSNEYAQISFMARDGQNAETFSLKPGEEQYNIPACLFKRKEVNQWFYGVEAINYNEAEEGELVTNLYERALVGEPVNVAGEDFDPIRLLQLYIKRSLSLVYGTVRQDTIKGIMFTVEDLTSRAVEVMEAVVAGLGLPGIRLAIQGREESIFYYIMRQPAELWQYDVCVYDFSGDEHKSYRWYENKHTKPVVVFVDKNDHPEVRKNGIMGLDQAFLQVINNTMEGRIVTCAYLIGDGFDGDWCVESVRELCRNRRAFRGNNLYSRGACYAMWDKLYGEKEAKRYIYLGRNKLKANVGMKVRRGREDSYIALLNGGDNWYDASKDCYCILESGNSFSISIVPLDGKNIRDIQVVLDGLTERPRLTTRLKISAFMETDSKLGINVTDMGFGTLFPASNQVFTKAIELYEG